MQKKKIKGEEKVVEVKTMPTPSSNREESPLEMGVGYQGIAAEDIEAGTERILSRNNARRGVIGHKLAGTAKA